MITRSQTSGHESQQSGRIGVPKRSNTKTYTIKTFVQKQVFAEDDVSRSSKNANQFNHKQQLIFNERKDKMSPASKLVEDKNQTQKKAIITSLSQPNQQTTVPKKKKVLKMSQGSSYKKNQYVYIVNPKTQMMKKYIVYQGQGIQDSLNKQQYIPPFQSCDQDCESTQQIVNKGVQYSRKDLFAQIRARSYLIPEGERANYQKLLNEPKQFHTDNDSQEQN